jgi:TolB protein
MRNKRRIADLLLVLAGLVLVGMVLPTAVPASQGGSGPDDALTPSSDWQSLNPGDTLWYGFYYAGGDSQLDIRMQVVPEEGANFAVWTPSEIRRWADGAEVDPIGRGSPDPSTDGLYVWSGSFTLPGAYYVVVEHTGSQPGPAYYLLEIAGDGVSYQPPTPTPAPTPVANAISKVAAPGKPSGKLVFQTIYGGPFYTINVDGSDLRRVTDGIDPIWSPDGTQIAFTRWRDPRGVWVVDADGSGERRVFDWDRARWPSWSPDASEILFSRMTGKGRQEDTEFCFRGFCFSFPAHPHWRLGLVQVGDGSFRELTSSEISHAPSWSPDGQRIVYDDTQGLRVQSPDGEVSYLITRDPRDTAPAWSPDGKRVAFVHRQHDHWEVYRVDADGRNLRRLTDTPRKPNGEVANSVAAAWSPDGAYIAFLTDRTGKWEIWVMRADGSQQRPMFRKALEGLPLEYSYVSERALSWTE